MLIKLSICVTYLLAVNTIYVVLAKSTPAPELVQVFKLPKEIPTCPEDDNVHKCIRNAFNFIVQNTANGIPEINIPPNDPLVLDRLNVQFSNTLMSGRASMRNVKISGVNKGVVKKTHYERQGDQVKLKVHFHIPQLHIEGQYKADVQLSSGTKLTPKGTFDITMIDFETKSEHFGELYERDGHTFMTLTRVNLEPSLGDMSLSATGLVSDPGLNESLLQIVNENWRPLYKSVVASNKPTWEPIILKYSNDYFSHIPFDLLITDRKD